MSPVMILLRLARGTRNRSLGIRIITWNRQQSHNYTDKKENKFSSYIRKFRVEQLQSRSYMRKGFLIYEEMRKYFPIYED
jgi:hypothetical protein